MATIYLAGPISGKDYVEVYVHFTSLARKLETLGYHVLHPMLGKEHLRNEKKFRSTDYRHPVSTNHAIFERDKWMVTKRADIILADLSKATEVSIGTCFELAWASQEGVHTVIVMQEEGNEHNHAFILEAADVHFETLGEAVKYLESLV